MANKSFLKFLEANRVKVGGFTRITTLASGNQAVSGLGFTPKAIIFFMCQNDVAHEVSWGVGDGINKGAVFETKDVNIWKVWTTVSIMDDHSGGNYYYGLINSLDTDGFTIAWTKVGLPSGTINIYYIAFR